MRELMIDRMKVHIYDDRASMGKAAAGQARDALVAEIAEKGKAAAIFACAPSQLDCLSALRIMPGIRWDRVTVFHMDEYLGMPETHPGSFRRFLIRELVSHVNPAAFHGIRGEAEDPGAEMARYTSLIDEAKPVLTILGIGENGHLAFNDPPADFDTPKTIHMVELDEKCRMQQVGEGHFPSLAETPTRAYSLTVPALLSPKVVVGVVPGPKKAEAVHNALEGPVSPKCPASILRTRGNTTLYLDDAGASLISKAGSQG
jgi:glucosamine-6-phosphate deaminase